MPHADADTGAAVTARALALIEAARKRADAATPAPFTEETCYNWSPTQRWCGRVTSTPHPTGKGLPMHSSDCTTSGSDWPHGYGFCHCGCGKQTSIAKQSDTRKGWVRGHPKRFCSGHNPQLPRPLRVTADLFWSKVDRSGGPDACWLWTGATSRAGYGIFGDGKVIPRYVHRAAWVLTHGPIPPGMFVCHHCDNPPCCNPYRCLFLGTPADNMADRDAKGRAASGDRNAGRLYPGMNRGENNGYSKLTRELVLAIRADHAAGIPQREIARRRGIHGKTVYNIVHGYRWGHVI